MLEMNNFVTAGRFFAIIAGELILIFVAVSFLIGLITEYLPPEKIREFLSNKFKWLGYLFGAGLGALTPFCSCSTVPITAGLLQGGVPFGPTMAFLFSSPVLNPIIIALFLTLLGYKVAIVYVAVTFLGSMLAAATLSRLGMENQVKTTFSLAGSCCSATSDNVQSVNSNAEPILAGRACCAEGLNESKPVRLNLAEISSNACCSQDLKVTEQVADAGSCCATNHEIHGHFSQKLKRAFISAMGTFKQVFWYLLLGAGIGAFIYGFFPQELVVKLAGPGNPWSIPIAAAIGVPMYIRAETVIPISAALVGKGMGVGTVLALIIGGAGASIPEIILLSAIFKRRLLIAFALNVFTVAIIAGYLVDWFLY